MGLPSSSMASVGAPCFLAALGRAGDIVTDPAVLDGYRRDQAAPGLLAAGAPRVLVRPTTTAQVQSAVRAAAAHHVPVVPRGAGSGLSGGANAIDGCLVLCLERMNRVLDVDPAALTATVQAGVVNASLGQAAREAGAWYPPDPASFDQSTIGGNVATNAGGLCCVKYGVTRDVLLALEVVMADGQILEIGHHTRKGVVGYDLAALLCGSEGTLGVITKATVRLLPAPRPASTLAASFASLQAAGQAVISIAREMRPSLLELMDATTIGAVEDFHPMELERDLAALIFAQSDAGQAEGALEIDGMRRICEQSGATLVAISDEQAEGRMLMAARRLAYPALERLGTTLLDDGSVPLPAIPALLEGVARIARDRDVLIGTFGHAGDGNMHPTIVYDHRDPQQLVRAREAFDAILELALALGGTISGEHGIGLLKRHHVAPELGSALAVHRSIKRALDPQGLLNPGKAL